MSETPMAAPEASTTKARAPRWRVLVEWVAIIGVALTLSIVVRDFGFQTFYIPSGSMEPTLQVGDRIIVDKLSVRFGTINRGDILVFKAPPAVNTQCGDADADLVKRVVGIPGDRVSSKGNTIYVNGKPYVERWSHTEPFGKALTPTTVPANDYFMIGDNHSDSCDSRYWGFVPRGNVIGKVFLRIWPFGRIAWI